jgi:hypothetical protein
MEGREDKVANNLFFLCSLIEYIGRETKNHRNIIVNAIGKNELQHIISQNGFKKISIYNTVF